MHVGVATGLAWCEVEEDSLEQARRSAYGRACYMASWVFVRGGKGLGKAW